MSTKCKLFYQIDPPLPGDLPIRATVKEAIGQQREILEQVQDYGQVTYHSDSALPFIKNIKGRAVGDSLLPASLPAPWQSNLPDTLGFHMHENFELTLITRGRMLYIADGTCMEATAGDLIFFSSYIPHAWIPDRSAPVNVIEITVRPDWSNPFFLSSQPILAGIASGNPKYLHIPCKETVVRRIRSIADELSAREYGYRSAVAMELTLVLLELVRHTAILPEKSENGQNQVIRRAREYIAAHLSENPGLPEIAAAVYVTPHHLSFLFKKQVGIGIADYMNQQKLLRTAELLSDSELSVLDIALQSGFTSKSNFYRVFKEYYGITPQQMRDALADQNLSEPAAQHTTVEVTQ